MTERDRLMTALFDNPQREHLDIKFLLGGPMDITSEDVCREAVKMIEQMDASKEGDEEFVEAFETRSAEEFLTA